VEIGESGLHGGDGLSQVLLNDVLHLEGRSGDGPLLIDSLWLGYGNFLRCRWEGILLGNIMCEEGWDECGLGVAWEF
jgi:hypothetical protein